MSSELDGTTHVVQVGTTDPRGGDPQSDKVSGELIRLGGGALDDRAVLGSLEYGERRHCSCRW
jgi:hypothetical protein